ncbi:MAG: aspartate ammonia-lyase [Candidatus Micrarchaeales archaeon]
MGRRIEKDSLGEVGVDSSAYYGASTQRAMDNFQVSGLRIQKEFIHSYALIKKAAAFSNMSEGILDKRIGNAITAACDDVAAGKLDEQFVVDVFQAGAGTSTNMNLNEVIANRAIERIGGKLGDYRIVHPNDHVNMSQSTNDTFHTAMHICTSIAINHKLIPALSRLQTSLQSKSSEFKAVLKVGRTHLQDAVPITLGQEFSGYAYSVHVVIERLLLALDEISYIPIGGTALGTGINTTPRYRKEVIKRINLLTKLRFKPSQNLFFEMQDQASEAFVSASLRNAALSLMKIANDFRLLSSGPQTGLGDITLPAVQPGSSIMPGKVNPSMAEMLNMVCLDVIGSDATVSAAAQNGQLELNVFMPIVAYKLLYSIEILSNGIDAFTKRCVSGVKANRALLLRRFDESSEIATLLAPELGYERVAEIVKESLRSGKSIRVIVLSKGLIDKKRLEELLDPSNASKPNLMAKK